MRSSLRLVLHFVFLLIFSVSSQHNTNLSSGSFVPSLRSFPCSNSRFFSRQ